MQIKTTSQIHQLVSSLPNKDSLLYFSYIILKRNTNKSIYLSSQALKKTFGDRNYTLLRNQLVELGVIEIFSNYREGGYQYLTYKILLPTSKKEWIDYEITNTKLIKRVEFIIENNYNALKPHIKNVLNNLEKLIITPELLAELKKDGIQLEDEINFTNNDKFKSRINQSGSGRVHHTLTNLNRKYRKKLSSKLGNLVEIDAKNAQLIFLSQLCKDDKAFNADVFGGVFYEKLSNMMGIDILTNKDVKDAFKLGFFNTILCNENKAVIANSKYTSAFKLLYPIMFNFLLTINNDKTKASTLQKLESEFFITNIVKDIVEKNLFVIPVHDAVIVLEKDVDVVKSIIDGHSIAFFNKLIITSITNYTFCSTPYDSALLIKEGIKREGIHKNSNNKCICSANDQGVEQNKNKLRNQETIEKIAIAIIKLKEEGLKMTTRNIQTKSGVSIASINKHYKAILVDLNDKEIETEPESPQAEIYKLEPSNELKMTAYTSITNEIMSEFHLLYDTYNFPADIAEIYINHINTNGFDSIDEMIDEVYSHPILKHLINIKQIA